MGSLYPQYILLPAGYCVELSKVHRYILLGTSSEEGGTSCKHRRNAKSFETIHVMNVNCLGNTFG